MSKLSISQSVPRDYNAASIQEIVRKVEQQANDLAEGKIVARHGSMSAAPTAGTWVKGDLVDNSSPAVVSSDIADYVIVGWVCTVSGTPGTWKERRVLVEDITATQLGTEVASTSGTSIDFTGIPSWVKRIVIQFVGVSSSGTSEIVVQLGDAGDVENTGYSGSQATLTAAPGININGNNTFFYVSDISNAAIAVHGQVILTLEDSAGFTWTQSGVLAQTGALHLSGGSKSLSAALDRVRITHANGTDTFDAGAINILYE